MTAITAADRDYIRRKVGDTGVTPLFSDSDLAVIWTDAGEDRSRAILECLQELMVNAAKFNDYTIGQTSEKKQQVFQNLRMMVDYWQGEIDTSPQFKMVGLSAVPERDKDMPYDTSIPALRKRGSGGY